MILDELRLHLDAEQLRAFLACYSGTYVTFKKQGDDPEFAALMRVIGKRAANELRKHFAGEKIYVPRGIAEERRLRDDDIRARIAAGESPKSIARSYRSVTTLSERHVQRIAGGVSKAQTGTRTTAENDDDELASPVANGA